MLRQFKVWLDAESRYQPDDPEAYNSSAIDERESAIGYAAMKLAVDGVFARGPDADPLPTEYRVVVEDLSTHEQTHWRIPVVLVPELGAAEWVKPC